MKYQLVDKETNEIITPHYIGLAPNGQLYSDGMNVTSHYHIRRYTGMKDKNENEIYEGDIVLLTYDTNLGGMRGSGWHRGEYHAPIVYWADGDKRQESAFVYKFLDYKKFLVISPIDFSNRKEIEIVGNMYQHPHLLQE